MTETRPQLRAGVKAAAMRLAPPLRRLVADRDRRIESQVALREGLAAARAQVADMAERNAILQAQLAASRNEGVRQDDYEYLFVIAYGRSGSTLLQGILNSVPGYLIRGENRDAFYRLGAWHRALAESKQAHLKATDPTYSWFGIGGYETEAALNVMRTMALHLVLKPEPDTRVIGFKEIRWWHADWSEHLTFMQQLFPGARFIINTRNHEAVARSKWWVDNPNALDALAEYDTQLAGMEKQLGESVYRVNFDDYVADAGALKGLFHWLGADFDRERLDAVMAIKHSS